MTKLRARVVKLDGSWIAVAACIFPGSMVPSRHRWADTHAQAMERAFQLLAEIDTELMDEVHASRSSRHAAKNERLKAETTA